HESGERGGDLGRLLGRDAGPWRQLVTAQAEPDDGHFGGGANRLDYLAGEEEPVRAPVVGALVREPRQELTKQAVLPGVDLHAVPPRIGGHSRGVAKPGDYRGDVLGLHPLRDFAAVALGPPRRRPQRPLTIGGRALPAAVAERGDEQAA